VVQTRNGTRREWVQLYEGRSDTPFLLDDGTGQVRVLPEGAEVKAAQLLNHTNGGVSLFGGGGQAGALAGPMAAEWAGGFHRRRYSEWRIDVRLPVLGLGVLRPQSPGAGDASKAVLAKGLRGEPFLLSTESEAELDRELGMSVALRLGGGLLLLLVGGGLLLANWR